MLVAESVSRQPSFARAALLIFWLLAILIGVICSLLNWYFSLASVFAVRGAHSSIHIVDRSYRSRAGSTLFFGCLRWPSFGIAQPSMFVVAGSADSVPFEASGSLPGGMVFGGVLLVTTALLRRRRFSLCRPLGQLRLHTLAERVKQLRTDGDPELKTGFQTE